jgi:hypothetical protein
MKKPKVLYFNLKESIFLFIGTFRCLKGFLKFVGGFFKFTGGFGGFLNFTGGFFRPL